MKVDSLFSMKDDKIIITGASRGIGSAIAEFLCEAGARVTLVARDEDELRSLATRLNNKGYADFIALDVTDLAAVKNSRIKDECYDVLINNAGTNHPLPFQDVTEEIYDKIINLNTKSTYFLTQLVVSNMLREGTSGSIINISSQMGHVGAKNRSVYCMSKFALEGMTRALAVELAPHNIRVNTVCPTFIETPMTKGFLEDESFRTEVLAKIKTGRLARPNDLFGAIALLASVASQMMTGSSLMIDGGWTAD
ncbi:MAG: SDR family oxidoreductase [Pantoea sp.]|uniref:SDR family NAD(P)-dependent oxidoreductase n=1 Tax=Pantoea sp. TaxID=69393 RepID=UPI0039E21579